MENTHDRGNTLPFIAGTLATLTLLASGVFAIAPYIAFLSPIAALGISLPITLIIFMFSIAVIAFTYKIISKNKKSDEISRQVNSHAIKDEVEKRIKNLEESNILFNEKLEVLASTATTSQTEEKLYMKFYEKGKARGNKPLKDFILEEHKREELIGICKLIKENISKMSLEKSGSSEENRKVESVGCILYGPPGTGKSTIVEAIADEFKSLTTFIKVPGSDLLRKSSINEVFNKAEENAPCIVLIDEVDSIGTKRTGDNQVSLNYFFTRLDEARRDVIVLATTNVCVGNLDTALTRGGRLSKKIEFHELKGDTLRKVLKTGLKKKLKGTEFDSHIKNILEDTANITFSAANLNDFINYAVEQAKSSKKPNVHTMIKNFCDSYGIPSKKPTNTKHKLKVATDVQNQENDSGYSSGTNTPSPLKGQSLIHCH
ncbi:MAG: ATP-binding protein [Wolbachia sp.]